MPRKTTVERAKKDARQGKAPSTQAGEFVREEIHHVREGKHGARSAKQAIAIGLSKARKAGVALPPQPGAKSSAAAGKPRKRSSETSATRSRATLSALKKEPKSSASHAALARQAHKSAVARGPASLHEAAMKAVSTKGASRAPQSSAKGGGDAQQARALTKRRSATPLSRRIAGDVDVHHQPAAAGLLGVVVGRVMGDVAVDHPLARLARRPDDVVALARADVDACPP